MSKRVNKNQLSKLVAPKDVLKNIEERVSVCHKLINICSELYLKYQDYFSDIPISYARELFNLKQYHSLDPKLIKEIENELQQQEYIMDHPFLAAIVTSHSYVYDREKYQDWLALILLCSLQLFIVGKHNSAIESALREIRLIATSKKHSALVSHLPSLSEITNLHTLSQLLDEKRKVLIDKSDPAHSYYKNFCFLHVLISHFLNSIEDMYLDKDKVLQRNHDSESVILKEEHLNGIAILTTQCEPKTDQEKDEDLSTEETIIIRDSIRNKDYQSITIKKQKSESIHNNFIRNNLSVRSDINQLTIFDIKHLVKHCIDNIDKKGENWLLLSLLTGRTPEYLYDKIQTKITLKIINNNPYFILKHKVPANSQPDDILHLLPKITTKIEIPLPFYFQPWIQKDKFKAPLSENLNSILTDINKKYQTRLTLNRISSYLEHFLLNEGIDDVIISILKNETHKTKPSLSYSCIEINSIQNAHRLYSEHVLGLVNDNHTLLERNVSDKKIGSPLFIPDNICRNYFNLLNLNINNSKNFDDFHNNFLLFTLLLLFFCTGHRAVNAPFGMLSDYNPEEGTWWISDKVCRISSSSRIIHLPTTAQNQLDHFLKHLEALLKQTHFISPIIAERCEKALDCKENLFFALIFNKGKYHPVDIKPSIIDKLFKFKPPFQHNWGRHYIRSFLAHNNIHSELINAWMGHGNLGEEAFGEFSGLAFSDLKSISHLIEMQLNTLQIKGVPGWKIP